MRGHDASRELVGNGVVGREDAEIVEDASWLFGQEQFTGRVLSSAVCLYASTPDHDFVIDRHPAHPNVVFGAGFSGHGFKFAPAIGEHLVQLAFGETATRPLFALKRFATAKT